MIHEIDHQSVRITAEEELRAELRRAQIDRLKVSLREKLVARKWWHRFVPFVVTIRRRT